MAALPKDRQTRKRRQGSHSDLIATGVQVFAGSIVVLNATGFAAPATAAAGLRTRGIADHGADNRNGADGAGVVKSMTGAHLLSNAGDINQSHIGATAYITDDHTVTAVSTASSAVGRIEDVGADGVWVYLD